MTPNSLIDPPADAFSTAVGPRDDTIRTSNKLCLESTTPAVDANPEVIQTKS
ncbi:hypothetical protein E4U35_002328 [Claviceps purpurea]|nr:hypothetical protein E4U35_002328 [Claviceps purpurea]